MTEQATEVTVRGSVVVEAPVDETFRIFTEDIGSWWPPEHHILQAPLASMVFEPRVGGHVYDRGVDGSECRWARVLAYDPPERVVFTWDIALDWSIEQDPGKTSEIEVRFVSEGEDRTRVELEHRKLERHGPGWEAMRDAVGSEGGWAVGLGRLADRIAGGGAA
jgi:uncharacterized protein YndB with AHSA1/START domain